MRKRRQYSQQPVPKHRLPTLAIMVVVLVVILYLRTPMSDGLARIFVSTPDPDPTRPEPTIITPTHPEFSEAPDELAGAILYHAYQLTSLRMLSILGQHNEP